MGTASRTRGRRRWKGWRRCAPSRISVSRRRWCRRWSVRAVHVLRALGFTGPSDEAVLRAAGRDAPEVLSACASASSMWTANAGTTTPATDHADGRLHFTPANLARNFHRAIEAPDTAALWRRLLPDPARFVHHPPLPGGPAFADEGAANHTRLAPGTSAGTGSGLHLFVHGGSALRRPGAGEETRPQRFPVRQTREASEAVARLHGLDPAHVVFARQNPVAIDAGVFHNDVIATGNEGLFLFHTGAFADSPAVAAELTGRWQKHYPDAEPLRPGGGPRVGIVPGGSGADLPVQQPTRHLAGNGGTTVGGARWRWSPRPSAANPRPRRR